MKAKLNNLIARYETKLKEEEEQFIEGHERAVVNNRIHLLRDFITDLKRLRG
jgi:hypothetical protein